VAAVFYAASPELTRPARRLITILLALIAVSLVSVTGGYPTGIIGALGLAWMMAAIAHLVLGSPDGAPDGAAVRSDLSSMGIECSDLRRANEQQWGETVFIGHDDDGPLRVAVIGRDSTNAQFLAKLFRFIWMKDSGPGLAATREQQIEHRAYLLMVAERAAAPAPRVIESGSVGERGDVVLVMREAEGSCFDELNLSERSGPEIDSVLDSAWSALTSLHRAGISHGGICPSALRLSSNDLVSFVDLASADGRPSGDALIVDQVSLLTTLASLATPERSVSAAQRALGSNGLTALQPLLEAAALPRPTRRGVKDLKKVTAALSTQVADITGVNLGTVKSRLNRARTAFADIIAPLVR
jgi:tRNA A-37 threonylcarbamoyl transferase component Bud32